jgi:peptidoglycan hydrolase-like protein with peptidoglycan-binding domain
VPSPPTISEGSQGEVVEWVQYLLVRFALSDNQIDGIFGPVTRAAVEQYQTFKHLAVDGIVGPITWGALGGDRPQPPTLHEGATGALVQKLQTAVNEIPEPPRPLLVVDGDFGPLTAAAVRSVQQGGGIKVDGVVGLQTWALPVATLGRVIADECGVTPPFTGA